MVIQWIACFSETVVHTLIAHTSCCKYPFCPIGHGSSGASRRNSGYVPQLSYIFAFWTVIFLLLSLKPVSPMAEIHQHRRRKCRFWNKSSGHWASLIPGGEEESRGNSHANPSWIEGCSWLMSSRRKIKWANGTQAGQASGNQRLLFPHVYRDPSPSHQLRSSCWIQEE